MSNWPMTLRYPHALLEKPEQMQDGKPVRVVPYEVAAELYRALNLQVKKPDSADGVVDRALSLYERTVTG